MIEYLLHVLAHSAKEKLNEGNELYEKKREEERKKRVAENQPRIAAILKDCEMAVLIASRKPGTTLKTLKWDADIDYKKMCLYLKDKGYPYIQPLDMKMIFTFDPISFLAQCACDRICDKLKIEH